MKRPRVLMADDHSLILAGLRKLVEVDCDVVGTVEDGRALVEAAQQLRPDLILLDISMPLLNGLEAARKLRTLAPDCKLIFLTMHASPTYAAEAFQAGASGYLLKRSAASELGLAIASVLQGQHYLTPLLTKEVLASVLKPSTGERGKPVTGALTARQREVLQLVAEGHGTKEIATILSISVKTVEFHKSRIMQHLDLHTTADLTKYAVTHGITGL
ncbi:MAG: response regulator transcription factor [Nitrospirota bacterium]|nr:response regulator transcription factor [Nitrospirota bacterium]MDP2382061.1 response regulator transcription factor [Nitrospirota bacterium]MDP3599395.1 response regulator transcription factor [Nitrospirota bacterium]